MNVFFADTAHKIPHLAAITQVKVLFGDLPAFFPVSRIPGRKGDKVVFRGGGGQRRTRIIAGVQAVDRPVGAFVLIRNLIAFRCHNPVQKFFVVVIGGTASGRQPDRKHLVIFDKMQAAQTAGVLAADVGKIKMISLNVIQVLFQDFFQHHYVAVSDIDIFGF